MHDGVEIIEEWAFNWCPSLRGINLSSVRVMEAGWTFRYCSSLEDVEFGDKLDTIGHSAFHATSLRTIKTPKVRTIGDYTFFNCEQLTEADFSKDLERIGEAAFLDCPRLRRISIPLKDNLLENDNVFRMS